MTFVVQSDEERAELLLRLERLRRQAEVLDGMERRRRLARQAEFLDRNRAPVANVVRPKAVPPRFYNSSVGRLQVPPGWDGPRMAQAAAEIAVFCKKHPWAKALFCC
jgi:hypothetical protein